MEKYSFVFWISDNRHWPQLFAHIENLLKLPDSIDYLDVVVTDNAILSCLKQSNLDGFKVALHEAVDNRVVFWLCGNTMRKYNFNREDLIPNVIRIVDEGGLMKIAELEKEGYCKFQL